MNVEKSVNAFVKEMGGEIVTELLPKSPGFENADYIFRRLAGNAVVAELKCLTQDSIKKVTEETLGKWHARWTKNGLVTEPPQERFRLNLKELPMECQQDLWNWLGNPISGLIEKANRQIEQTKLHFGFPSAKGLLLLVNDGNYSLESDTVLNLTNQLLGNQYSKINSVIYFTVNMEARMPNTECNIRVLVEAHRQGIPCVSKEFVKALMLGWKAFYERAIGSPVPTLRQGSLDQIKFKRP